MPRASAAYGNYRGSPSEQGNSVDLERPPNYPPKRIIAMRILSEPSSVRIPKAWLRGRPWGIARHERDPTMNIDDAEVQRLLDLVAIQEVLNRYCRGIDRVDGEILASCYHSDAIDTHPGTTPDDQRNFISWAMEQLPNWADGTGGMMHYLTNINVDIDGDVAWAESYFHAFHWGLPRDDPERNYMGGGRYIDRLERRDGMWKISERKPLREFRFVYPLGSLITLETDEYHAARDATDPSYDRPVR
jgi:hypothetical protein